MYEIETLSEERLDPVIGGAAGHASDRFGLTISLGTDESGAPADPSDRNA